MKRTLMMLCLLLSGVALAGEDKGFTVWTLGSTEEHSARVNIGFQYLFIEAGISSTYFPWDEAPQTVGGYLYGISEETPVQNPLPEILFFLPDKIPGRFYGGGTFGFDVFDDDDDRSYSGWTMGVLITVDEHVSLVAEYGIVDRKDSLGDALPDDNVTTIGLRIKFK